MSDKDFDQIVYTSESTGTGWVVGIIVFLALLAIGFLIFSAGPCGADVCATTLEASQ